MENAFKAENTKKKNILGINYEYGFEENAY